jgi:acetyl-CoA synthetase
MNRYETIQKGAGERAAANLDNYAWVRHDFSWEHARRHWLSPQPAGRLNVAYQALDRHLRSPQRDRIAVRTVGCGGVVTELTYAALAALCNRFVNVLATLGVRRGERLFVLLPPGPDLFVASLGGLRSGVVVAPLSFACGDDMIVDRLAAGSAAALVTTPEGFQQIARVRGRLPGLRHVLVTGPGAPPPDTCSLVRALANAGVTAPDPATGPADPAVLLFTAGTVGRPKAAIHVHGAVAGWYSSALYALDLHPGDTLWCTADPGRAGGMVYGVLAPLLHGLTVVVDTDVPDAGRWYRLLQDQRITVWYTTPAAVRLLMHPESPAARGYDLSALRHVAAGGSPLTAEAVAWSRAAWGRPVHDTWWQAETGAIMIANFAGLDVHPGSLGLPLPGVQAALLEPGVDGRARLRHGRVHPIEHAGEVGELALRAGWPSMFRGYVDDPQGYARCFADGWYLTGDLARRDGGGALWFAGRA